MVNGFRILIKNIAQVLNRKYILDYVVSLMRNVEGDNNSQATNVRINLKLCDYNRQIHDVFWV